MATSNLAEDPSSLPGSPLSSIGGQPSSNLSNTPTLRPSLRERHDYVIALLADGTLVIWLLLGLSVVPRCSPKVVIWANLPEVVHATDSAILLVEPKDFFPHIPLDYIQVQYGETSFEIRINQLISSFDASGHSASTSDIEFCGILPL